MVITVKQLIKELKKYPPHYCVGFACHDNEMDEISDLIDAVYEFEPSKNTKWPDMSKKWVVLRT